MAKDRYPVAPAKPVTLNPNRATPNPVPSLGPVGVAATSPVSSPVKTLTRQDDDEKDDDKDDDDDITGEDDPERAARPRKKPTIS